VKCSQPAELQAGLAEAAELLRQGQPVVFPTETVYGVGASAAGHEAVERLRQVKGRAEGKPFTVHVSSPADAEWYVDSLSRIARRFIQKTWPGPLTLILDAPKIFDPQLWRCRAAGVLPPVPELVYHDGTVGLRCPANDVAREVLRRAQVPVVASSANQVGRPPPLDAAQALRELDGRVPLVLDAGPTRYTAASSIVQVQGDQWSVIREGVLSERYLRKLLSMTLLFVCTGNTCRSPMAEVFAKSEAARRLGCAVEELESRHEVTILSAGVFAPPGREASQEAREAAGTRGANLAEHRSTPLSTERIREADAVFCMTRLHREAVLSLLPEAADKIFLLDPEGRDIEDPMGCGIERYDRCAEQIQTAVRKRMEERFA
jgi:protein-tyrosine phosphatase